MFAIITIFFFAALASFLGSLQLGPVNLYVMNTVLYRTKRDAYWVSLGGALPEFIYCSLAVFANHFLQEYALVQLIFRIAFVVVLFGVGLSFLFKKQAVGKLQNDVSENHIKPLNLIAKGFSLAALNPQLLPFWIFVQVYFNSIYFLKIESGAQQISFILGAGVGAFVLLLTVTSLVSRYKTQLVKYASSKYYFIALALLFFAIAIQQLIALLNS
ncbi:MAG: LysE family translocator [Bacteroidia bacterium]